MSLTLCRAGRRYRRGKHETPQHRTHSRFEVAGLSLDSPVGHLSAVQGLNLPSQLLPKVVLRGGRPAGSAWQVSG
jgi:hypothetical protein